ncbi:hypothetical protein [Streptomyces sulphureus]|uniref:hypothetical protein n=1 Tax=Streptomyces sulphureus TaxID=47758 RepID=UPI000367602D|nr:hypothetical protein [Streptomyces sulphureus]
MTSSSTEGTLAAGALPESGEPAWDHPLTRLVLLLEIAEEPSWLRELTEPGATGR